MPPRRLTPRQTAVLAAVERLGRPTILDVREEVTGSASELERVLRALEKGGLVASAGNPDLVYAGEVRFWATGRERPERREALAPLVEAARAAGLTAWADDEQDAVIALLPLAAIEAAVESGSTEELEAVHNALRGNGVARQVEVTSQLRTDGPQAALELLIKPV